MKKGLPLGSDQHLMERHPYKRTDPDRKTTETPKRHGVMLVSLFHNLAKASYRPKRYGTCLETLWLFPCQWKQGQPKIWLDSPVLSLQGIELVCGGGGGGASTFPANHLSSVLPRRVGNQLLRHQMQSCTCLLILFNEVVCFPSIWRIPCWGDFPGKPRHGNGRCPAGFLNFAGIAPWSVLHCKDHLSCRVAQNGR